MKMFTSTNQLESKQVREKEKNVANIVFMSYFWNIIVLYFKVSYAFVCVLRLVDGEKRYPMHYIYDPWKGQIKELSKALMRGKTNIRKP